VNYVLDIELKLAPESSEYRTKLSPHQTLSMGEPKVVGRAMIRSDGRCARAPTKTRIREVKHRALYAQNPQNSQIEQTICNI
jgi:hypothetical protein